MLGTALLLGVMIAPVPRGTGKAMLRDLVNATIGFEALSAEVRKPSKSLHRMLAARGNPSTENFFGIVKALQKKTRTRLRVAVQAG